MREYEYKIEIFLLLEFNKSLKHKNISIRMNLKYMNEFEI